MTLASGVWAVAMILATSGYSFMAGNHEVYLLEPLRRAGLASFSGDYFVTGTLQYHGLFAWIASVFLRADGALPGLAAGAFLVLTLGQVAVIVWAWQRIVFALGGGVATFIVAVVMYHVLLGDRALGFYSLVQDGQFNAGNVAAAALLAGIALWLGRRPVAAGGALGVAGAFHLNYAVVCPVLWGVSLAAWAWRRAPTARKQGPLRAETARERAGPRASTLVLASLLAVIPAALNILAALSAKLERREAMSLERFVELYVKLRHPHHYDPLGWPWWVWLAFMLPLPLAAAAWWRVARGRRSGRGVADPRDALAAERSRAWNDAGLIWCALLGLQVVALVAAGLFWLSETAVQMSLWRFSPHAKLLAVSMGAILLVAIARRAPERWSRWRLAALVVVVAGALGGIAIALQVGHRELTLPIMVLVAPGVSAWVALEQIAAVRQNRRRLRRETIPRLRRQAAVTQGLPLLAGAGLVAAFLAMGQPGLPFQPPPHPEVLAAAEWARAETDTDATFLVPPDASEFALTARRGVVVSFKCVPQLSAELEEWAERLSAITGVAEIADFAGGVAGYHRSQAAMHWFYANQHGEWLLEAARRYGASHVLVPAEGAANEYPPPGSRVVWVGAEGWVIYELPRE